MTAPKNKDPLERVEIYAVGKYADWWGYQVNDELKLNGKVIAALIAEVRAARDLRDHIASAWGVWEGTEYKTKMMSSYDAARAKTDEVLG